MDIECTQAAQARQEQTIDVKEVRFVTCTYHDTYRSLLESYQRLTVCYSP